MEALCPDRLIELAPGLAFHFAEGGDPARDLRAMGDGAVLAITIENPAGPGREPVRYQGLVPLESDSLAGAFEG
jgi:molecular chaperone Hsp33